MAILRIKLKEQIILNNQDYGSEQIYEKSGINEIIKRIVSVPTAESGLIGFISALSSDLGKSYVAGIFDEDDVYYMRITNLDDTNHITLTFREEGNREFAIKLDAGHSFLYPGDNSAGVVDTMTANAGSVGLIGNQDLVDVVAIADSSACDVEVFVASA